MFRPRHLSEMVEMRPGKEAVGIIGEAMGIADMTFHNTIRNSGSISYCFVCNSYSRRRKLFVKCCKGEGAKHMFEGEMASIDVLYSTQTVNIPRALQLVDFPNNGVAMVMEHLELTKISDEQCALLGDQVARLHLNNAERRKNDEKSQKYVGRSQDHSYIDKFGFHITTYHGFFTQNTSWTDDWLTFFTRKLEEQMDRLQKRYGCREIQEAWAHLVPKIPSFFKGVKIEPSLLHGDLWYGNVAGSANGPVVYDPCSFYGHSEYEIAYCMLCPEFHKSFYDSYFTLIPKAAGFDKRVPLYQLYTAMNEWNHCGEDKYKTDAIQAFRKVLAI